MGGVGNGVMEEAPRFKLGEAAILTLLLTMQLGKEKGTLLAMQVVVRKETCCR